MSVLAAAKIGMNGDGIGLEFLIEGVQGFMGRDADDAGWVRMFEKNLPAIDGRDAHRRKVEKASKLCH
jgi:hypothetical protein